MSPVDVQLDAIELARTAELLETLSHDPARFFNHSSELKGVRAAASRLIDAIQKESRRRRSEQASRESAKSRRHSPVAPAPKRRRCYICHEAYRDRHPFYESLCPDCARLNYERREQTADLHGTTALVTGGRIKIGHEVALKLLRAGASVVVTTRFPADAAKRFVRCEDFQGWKNRLQIAGIDLRDLRGRRTAHVVSRREAPSARHPH